MRKLTAALAFVLAILFLSLNQPFTGMVWLAISLVWLITAFVFSSDEPISGRRLGRRFARLFLFFS